MEIPYFSAWKIKHLTNYEYEKKLCNYTPGFLWGYKEDTVGLCIDKCLAEVLDLHKIPKDGLNKPIVFNGLWSNGKEFFIGLKGETDTDELKFFFTEISFEKWMKTIEWFYSISRNIKKPIIMKKIHEQMEHYIGIILKEA